MHLTKAETVNFHCGISFNAFCLELVVFQLYLYAVSVADVNISVSFVLIGAIVQLVKQRQVLKPPCCGNISYAVNGSSANGQWWDKYCSSDVLSINSTFSYWFLIIHFSDKPVRLLWRDSCSEWVYRYLVVQQKQRRRVSA